MRSRGAVLVIAATFGPYLALGIRTEQVVIYGLTAILTFRVVAERRKTHSGIIGLAMLWAFILAVSLISGMSPPPGAPLGSALGGIDALLAPLCVMLLMAAWCGKDENTQPLLETIQKTTVLLLAANTVLALSMSAVDFSGFMAAHWWVGDQTLPADGNLAVGQLAAMSGRYGGVFNSPLAGGTAYSVGLVAMIHLYLTRVWTGRKAALLIVALLVGGVLPQSKVFLLVGLPIALVLLLVGPRGRRVTTFYATAFTGVATYWLLSKTVWWDKFGQYGISQYLKGSADPMALYTAGRYGQTGVLGGRWDLVMHNAPWGGYGVTEAIGALDTSWLEMLARAGILGLIAFIVWLGAVTLMWLSRRGSMAKASWWSLGALILILLAASAGGPSLTQNRSGTLLLVNLLALVAVGRPGRPGPASRVAVPVPRARRLTSR